MGHTAIVAALSAGMGIAAPALAQTVEGAWVIVPRDGETPVMDQQAQRPETFAQPLAYDPAPERIEPESAPPPMIAAPPAPMPMAATGRDIRTVRIAGAEGMDEALFADAIASVTDAPATSEELAQLVGEIATIAREQGYVFASAKVPRQAIRDGELVVELTNGTIDDLRVIGSDNAALRDIMQQLVGQTAHRDSLSIAILQARSIPAIKIKGTRFLRQGDIGIVEITVEEDRYFGQIGVDNYGTDRFGPLRARISVGTAGLIDSTDMLRARLRTNPLDRKEIASLALDYEIALGSPDTRLALSGSYGSNEPGSGFSGSGLQGTSLFAGANIRHVLMRNAQTTIAATFGAQYLSIEQDVLDVLIRQDNQVTLSVGLSATQRLGKGSFNLGAEVSQGVDLFDTTRNGDPLASRRDGDGVFTKSRFWASLYQPLGHGFSVRMAANGQIANRALFSSQELSIGGPGSVRGYDFSELLGENGVTGLVELRRDFRQPLSWIDNVQAYGFIDGGATWQRGPSTSDGSILSAGGGLRGRMGKLNVEVESAWPISDDRRETGDKSPNINVNVGLDF